MSRCYSVVKLSQNMNQEIIAKPNLHLRKTFYKINRCGRSIRWVKRTCYLYRYTNCLRRGKTVNLAYNPVSPVYIEYLNGERKRDSMSLVLDPITKEKVNTRYVLQKGR